MAWLGGQGSTKSGKERRRHSMFHVMEHAAARVALEKSPDRSVTAWDSLRGRNFEARPMKPAPQYHLSHPQPAEPETALLFLGSFFEDLHHAPVRDHAKLDALASLAPAALMRRR
jgi:hypothetical protein